MGQEFANHAALSGGLSADLIRDVASDLRRHTTAVLTLVDNDDETPSEADLAQLAHHIEACTTMLHEMCQHRRAS